MNNIDIDAILKDAEDIENEFATNSKSKSLQILKALENETERVNFRELAGIKTEKGRVREKDYSIAVIDEIIRLSKANNFNLGRKNNTIYLYNAEYWEVVSAEDFKDYIVKIALKMGMPKNDARHHPFRDDLHKQFLAVGRLDEIKGGDKALLNLKNGTFEITMKRQKLREFRQSDFMKYQLPFNYDKDATAPMFQKFLNEVLPEKELQDILSEYLGYAFTKNGMLKLEKVLLLYGTGANGKSVVLDVVEALIGKVNITSYSLQKLTDDNGGCRADIADKILNYSSEINGKLDAGLFKQLASGEPIHARNLYSDPIIIRQYAKIMFNCNKLPKEVENTHGFFRRFMIIPFRVTIQDNKQDKDLAKRIIDTELSGVFNWVLDGLQRLLTNKKFTTSDIVKNEVLQYQKESDSVQMFLEEEEYTKSTDDYTLLKILYSAYGTYCNSNGNRAVSKTTFSKRLEGAGFVKERKKEGILFYLSKEDIDF